MSKKSKITELVILAEDLRSFTFLRHYAEKVCTFGRVRAKICTSGSGEQYVRENYASQVRELRRVQQKIKSVALIVQVDADRGSVQAERQLLDSQLTIAGLTLRDSNERIAIVIPKRHTETWIHGLCGESVTEDQDCKSDGSLRKFHDSRVKEAAQKLFDFTRNGAKSPPSNLPALAEAIPELQRLEQ